MCRPENIANAPHAPNLDVAAKLGQLFAEPRHLRLKRIGLNFVIEAVDRLDQDFARDDAVASHQKGFGIKASRRRMRTLLPATVTSLVPMRSSTFPNVIIDGTSSRGRRRTA